jgi:hypothetical protein
MFSWKPIYADIANRLLDFRESNRELVEILAQMHQRGLKALPYQDRDADGKRFPLEEIDPFTFSPPLIVESQTPIARP